MNKYEGVFIFPVEGDEYQQGLEYIREELKSHGATILREEDMRERELAYPIKNQERGHYHLFEITVESTNLPEIDETIRLHGGCLKYLFVRIEDE
jgi:small subunit ribosomal protein S6